MFALFNMYKKCEHPSWSAAKSIWELSKAYFAILFQVLGFWKRKWQTFTYNLPVLDPWFPHEYTQLYGFRESGRYPLYIKVKIRMIIFLNKVQLTSNELWEILYKLLITLHGTSNFHLKWIEYIKCIFDNIERFILYLEWTMCPT